jgi:hypothetical protein
MPAPVIAGIGAAASIGGSIIGASGAKKAASTAADAQVTAARETNALARDIYGRNSANFQPFMASGQRANALLDAFIYGGPVNAPQPTNMNAPMGTGGQFQTQGGGFAQPFNLSAGGIYTGDEMQGNYGGALPGTVPGYAPQPVPGAITASVQPQTAQSAWDQFRNSSNYQFRLGEGMNALNSGWAGAGALQSGAAMRDAIRYGQNFASNELNNYLSLLQGQQALGAGSASSLAGVGNDFLSSVTANNRMSADALSNAALLRGQANQNMFGGIANALGGFASSFGKPY